MIFEASKAELLKVFGATKSTISYGPRKFLRNFQATKILRILKGGIKTDKKRGIVLIFAILAVVVFASGCTEQDNVTVQNNTTTQPQNNTNVTKAIDVVAVQKGPETAKKGMNITIQYEITNNGAETVYNVQVDSQDFEQAVGTLKPGETKKYASTIYIPTDAEVQEDFGPNATVSNPFFIGGFSVKFNDQNGAKHSTISNPIEIKLP